MIAWFVGLFEAFALLIAVGTFGFWVLLSIAFLLIIWALEYNRGGKATLVLILTLLCVQYVCGYDLIGLAKSNPLYFGLFLLGYFVAGALWSIAKWHRFTKLMSIKYNKLKKAFLRSHKVEGQAVPARLKSDWQYRVRNAGFRTNDDGGIRPYASEHKSRILGWMMLWVPSMIWTIINDPVKRFFKYLFYRLQFIYESISIRNFGTADEDVIITPEEEKELEEEREKARGRR